MSEPTKPADEPELSSAVDPRVPDTRPRFHRVHEPALGGALRIRRFEPEQMFKQDDLFERHEINPKNPAIRKKGDKEQLCRLLQRCLVPMDHHRLIFSGGKGLLRLLTLPDKTVERLAKEVVNFQEF